MLNKDEYDTAYGNDGNIHFDFPLPKLLKRLFTSYSFLFLGCSLSADRTIQTFMRVAQLEGPDNLPHHYAILAVPDGCRQEDAPSTSALPMPTSRRSGIRRASTSMSSTFWSYFSTERCTGYHF